MPSHALAQRSLAAMPDPVRPAGFDLACYVTPAPGAAPAAPHPRVPEGTTGTLLAIVPIPGTESSLAIVGYEVPASPAARAGEDGPARHQPDGALVVDHARRRVWLEGAEIRLTYQEFELLAFLTANPAQVFSRADLLARVWPDCPPANTRTVDVHVSRLRRKLGPVHGQCLATEYRVGYRFEPAVRG
jgi:hypothetical protein